MSKLLCCPAENNRGSPVAGWVNREWCQIVVLLGEKKIGPIILVALIAHHTPILTSYKANWRVSM